MTIREKQEFDKILEELRTGIKQAEELEKLYAKDGTTHYGHQYRGTAIAFETILERLMLWRGCHTV